MNDNGKYPTPEKAELLFFDTEFTTLSKNPELISIGIVNQANDASFYAEFTDFRPIVDQWLIDNVIENCFWIDKNANVKYSHLPAESLGSSNRIIVKDEGKEKTVVGDRGWVCDQFKDWLLVQNKKQFVVWSDCLSWDWYLFITYFFGTSMNMTYKGVSINYIPLDICTLFQMHNIDPDISREEFLGMSKDESSHKHNSLVDAVIIRRCWEKLVAM